MKTEKNELSISVDQEYARVVDELRNLSAEYGTNSPCTYLMDYSPRIKAQIHELLKLIHEKGTSGARLLSIGGWPGISGIVLSRLTGIEVTLIDHPAVLGGDASLFYEQNGLNVVAYDFAESVHTPIPVADNFDIIECCQCIEHWNFNPVFAFKDLFGRVLSPSGSMFITVPNAVSLYRRLFTMMGFNPYPAIRSFIDSAEGLPGAEVSPHWREYTMNDLVELMGATGGECVMQRRAHHKLLYKMSIFQRIHQALHFAHPALKSNLEIVVKRKHGVDTTQSREGHANS